LVRYRRNGRGEDQPLGPTTHDPGRNYPTADFPDHRPDPCDCCAGGNAQAQESLTIFTVIFELKGAPMPHIGPQELIIILIIVVLLFGVGRIGKIAGEMGSGLRAFKEGLQGDKTEAEKEAEKEKAEA
jgi:sec-independent protein translocase protein TatA